MVHIPIYNRETFEPPNLTQMLYCDRHIGEETESTQSERGTDDRAVGWLGTGIAPLLIGVCLPGLSRSSN